MPEFSSSEALLLFQAVEIIGTLESGSTSMSSIVRFPSHFETVELLEIPRRESYQLLT